jgi:transcriptional regulator with GAF, ATPase, and Fis domain
LRQDWLVTLVLENRFAGTELATLDDHTIEQWVILAALSSRLTAGVADVMPRASGVGEQAPTAGDAGKPNGASSEDGERSETMSALAGENWNISRAARVLGMTRHGLKKRMRRLNLARS